MELKTMVDAIAAASQREAEAHETAIILAKENEELREKMKVLIEDNNKLIELYEGVVAGGNQLNNTDSIEQDNTADCTGDGHENPNRENYCQQTRDIECLQHQLEEMHEENDKLLGLYEEAMQEKDELKKLISSYDSHRTEAKEDIDLDCERVTESQYKEKIEELSGLYENAVQERDEYRRILSLNELNMSEIKEDTKSEEILCLVRSKLDQAQEQLEAAGISAKYFGLLEKASSEVDELQETVEALDQSVQLKQQELTAIRSTLPETLERGAVIEKKLLALKVALQNVSSKVRYWDKREEQARAKVDTCAGPLKQKKQELQHLKIRKEEADGALTKARLSESELRNNIAGLKLKWKDAETKRKENERVLFEIDNKPNFGKASDMLKSEEERSQVLAQIKQQNERLSAVQKEIADSMKISEALDAMIQSLEAGIESGTRSLQEAELRHKDIVAERQILAEMQEDGMTTELSKLLIEYQQCVFESDMKEEEIMLLDEALQPEVRSLEELRAKQKQAAQKLNNLIEESKHSEKIEMELRDVQRSVADAKSLLLGLL